MHAKFVELAVAPNTKTKAVSGFRTVVRQVHLWLGLSASLILASGIVRCRTGFCRADGQAGSAAILRECRARDPH